MDTRILQQIRKAADDIAGCQSGPRVIFLVGGPGNGKSQMVEEFVKTLDAGLRCNGNLVDAIADQFRTIPTPRVVEIKGSCELGEGFDQSVRALTIIQDASASDRVTEDAAEQLTRELLNLLTDPFDDHSPCPVLLCCVNRGLLARALMVDGIVGGVADLLNAILTATGLADDALSQRVKLWPLDTERLPDLPDQFHGIVACWPMDHESLFLNSGEEPLAPAASILRGAVDSERWEAGGCVDCDDRNKCPLFQNALWLRSPEVSANLLTILRRQELATGQRWNFRSLFSLFAEILVGEAEDFTHDAANVHPCEWIHQNIHAVEENNDLAGAFSLLRRLYPHALFASILPAPDSSTQEGVRDFSLAQPLSEQLGLWQIDESKFIRRYLARTVRVAMDPAGWSPRRDDDDLGLLEDAYSQSVGLGNDKWDGLIERAWIEEWVVSHLAEVEDECSQSSTHPASLASITRYLRQIAVTISKRSVAVRLGRHANEELLTEYANIIRDPDGLQELHGQLRRMLAGDRFAANALAALGQPESGEGTVIQLRGPAAPIRPLTPAPDPVPGFALHDFPVVTIGTRKIPLTYELFAALKLYQAGCSTASMPATVRASLDLMRQLYAGQLVRDRENLLLQNVQFVVSGVGELYLPSPDGVLRLRVGHE